MLTQSRKSSIVIYSYKICDFIISRYNLYILKIVFVLIFNNVVIIYQKLFCCLFTVLKKTQKLTNLNKICKKNLKKKRHYQNNDDERKQLSCTFPVLPKRKSPVGVNLEKLGDYSIAFFLTNQRIRNIALNQTQTDVEGLHLVETTVTYLEDDDFLDLERIWLISTINYFYAGDILFFFLLHNKLQKRI